MKLKLSGLNFLTILVALLAAVSSVSAKAAKLEDYRYLEFEAEKIRDDQTNHHPNDRKTIDISKTKYNGTLKLYFVPGDLKAPAFFRAEFNFRRPNHTFKQIDTGFRQALLAASEALQRVYDSIHEALIRTTAPEYAKYLPSELRTPLPANWIVFGAMDEPEDLDYVLASRVPVELKGKGMSFTFTMPLDAFANPAETFAAEIRTEVLENDSHPVVTKNIFFGSAKMKPIGNIEKSTLSNLIILSCQDSLGGAPDAKPRTN